MITPKLTIDERATNAYLKTLAKNEGKPLKDRTQRVLNASAKRHLKPALKAAAPRGQRRRSRPGQKRRKRLATSASVRLLRQRSGEWIRPTIGDYKAWHAHFYIGGTRDHNLGERKEGFAVLPDGGVRPLAVIDVSGVSPHPIVDQAWSRAQGSVMADVKRDVFEVK